MKISKSHQRLSNRLKNPRVIDHPEEFLGPNWKAVLNFWIYLDTLTEEQWEVIKKRYCDMCDDEWTVVRDVVRGAAKRTNSCWIEVYWDDAYWVAHGAGYATWELIASHELLNQQKPFIFLSLFLNL